MMINYNDKRNDLKMNSNMKFLESLGRNIKNIFVGSHRGEDFILENIEKTDKPEENPRPEEEIAAAFSDEKDFHDMSKEELEIYGRTIGIELDRRHNKSKLIKELEDHIQYIESV